MHMAYAHIITPSGTQNMLIAAYQTFSISTMSKVPCE